MKTSRQTENQKKKDSTEKQKQKKQKGAGRAPRARASAVPSAQVMSAFSGFPVPASRPCGNAFHTVGKTTFDLVTSTTDVVAVFLTNTGNSSILGASVQYSPASAVAITVGSTFSVPSLMLDDDNGGPTSGRSMKASFALVNVTKAQDRCGRVTIGEIQDRVKMSGTPSVMTGTQWDSLLEGVRSLPTMERPIDGGGNGRTLTRSTAVADRMIYETFFEWKGSEGNPGSAGVTDISTAAGKSLFDLFFGHIGTWTGSTHGSRPMTTRVIIFQPTATPQNYSIELRGAWYTRWPSTNVVAAHERPIPAVEAAPESTVKLANGGGGRPPR